MGDPQVVDFDDRFYWSLSQLQKAFGPARETISKRLHTAGVVARKKRAGHDVYHIAEAAEAILAGELPTFDGIDDPDKLLPKDRLDYYKAENERLKFDRDRQLVIDTADVRQEFARVVKTCVRTLETLPDILEMKCRLPSDAINLVESECDNAREQLAQELSE